MKSTRKLKHIELPEIEMESLEDLDIDGLKDLDLDDYYQDYSSVEDLTDLIKERK
jgi:hypothetical protein